MLQFWDDMQKFYHTKQIETPVYFDPSFITFYGHVGVWNVFRYEDVARVMSDYEYFSNAYMPKMPDNPLADNINQLDPPRHTLLRKLLMKSFKPELVDSMQPWMYEKATEIVSNGIKAGKMDFVQEVANPFPSFTINRLLGIPGENHLQVQQWVNAIVSKPDPSDLELFFAKQQSAMQEMVGYFMELLEEKSKSPGEDLLSYLLSAEEDNVRLTRSEVLGTAMALILAGNETTAGLIANSMLYLLENPIMLEDLSINMFMIPGFINEMLRFRSPVQSHHRIAIKDTIVGEKMIKAGDVMNVWLGSANNDPSVFTEPEKVNIYRPNFAKVASFGHGVHYCVGAVLSKIEVKIVLETILSKATDIQIMEGANLAMSDSNIVSSIQNLPITLKITKRI